MKKTLLLICLIFLFSIRIHAQDTLEQEEKAKDVKALSTLDIVMTSLKMYRAHNGTYPKDIYSENDLANKMGGDFPGVVKTSGREPGALIYAATDEKGKYFRIYTIGRDLDHCYGMAENGNKAGPDNLENLINKLGSIDENNSSKIYDKEPAVVDVYSEWKSVILKISNKKIKNDKEIKLRVNIGGDFLTVPNTKIKLKVNEFYPDFFMDGTGKPATKSKMPKNAAVQYTIEEEGKQQFMGWMFKKYPDVQNYPHDDISIVLVDYSKDTASINDPNIKTEAKKPKEKTAEEKEIEALEKKKAEIIGEYVLTTSIDDFITMMRCSIKEYNGSMIITISHTLSPNFSGGGRTIPLVCDKKGRVSFEMPWDTHTDDGHGRNPVICDSKDAEIIDNCTGKSYWDYFNGSFERTIKKGIKKKHYAYKKYGR